MDAENKSKEKEPAIEALKGTPSLPHRVFGALLDWALHILTDPVKLYSPSEVTNLRALKKRVQVGDVLLICGNARISHVVRVLTTSQWSHVVLYVGDRQDLLKPNEREEWLARFGAEALKHLIVDADPLRGVHLRPIDEYVGLMVRHCRAEALSDEDAKKVCEFAIGELGKEYDIRHIIQLLFFFAIPWELFPETVRRFATEFSLSESERICSRVLSEAFYSVGYPIRPLRVIQNRRAVHGRPLRILTGVTRRGRSAAKLFFGGRIGAAFNRLGDERYVEISQKGTRYITPADYDLSRFFSVIKDAEDLSIEYGKAETEEV